MTARILVIDEGQATAEQVGSALDLAGYQLEYASPGVQAIRRMLVYEPDLVILCLRSREEDWQRCRRLLTFLEKPLLLVLTTNNKMDKIKGLDLGADGCMVKPIAAAELLAIVRALLRRSESQISRSQQSYFVDGDLVIDLSRREVWLDGQPVALTAREFQFLYCFARHLGEVVSHEQLKTQIWGPDCPGADAAIKQYIYRLRQKLEPDPSHPQRLLSRRGQGYILTLLTDVSASTWS